MVDNVTFLQLSRGPFTRMKINSGMTVFNNTSSVILICWFFHVCALYSYANLPVETFSVHQCSHVGN